MTVFGIGTLELVLILLLLILIFGPERITELAKWLGQAYRKLTGVTNEINQQVSQVRKAIDTTVDTGNLANPLHDITKEINQAQAEVNREISKTQQQVQGIQQELGREIAPRLDSDDGETPPATPDTSEGKEKAQAS